MIDPADLRPPTADEWPAFAGALFDVFADEPQAGFVDRPPATAEIDRALGLWDGDAVVATSGIYSRELTVPGGLAPCAAVTWVTVAATHRRQGVLTAIMRRQLDGLHARQREPVAALWASEGSIYGRFGYAPATYRAGLEGRTERLALRRDVDLGGGRVVRVDRDGFRPAAAAVHERLRRWVPGAMLRDERWWDRQLRQDADWQKDAGRRRFVLHLEADGSASGYASFRVRPGFTDEGEPDSRLTVEEVRGAHPVAYARLWQHLLSVDLVRTIAYPAASLDDPLRHLLADPRALHSRRVDALWVRLVDVDRALALRRYPAPLDLVLEVRDPFCRWNEGRWRLSGHPAGGYCGRTDRDPDLVVDIEALGAAYLGGVSLATLQAAGRVTEISPGAVTLAATAFSWPVTPWCPDEF